MRKLNYTIEDFDYDLDESKIAKFPLKDRDLSKLLVFRKNSIADDIYKNINEYVPEKSFLVFNNTKVVQARLRFKNNDGLDIEIFCLEPTDDYSDVTSAMSSLGSVNWNCLIGRKKRWIEEKIQISLGEITLVAQILQKERDCFKIKFEWSPKNISFSEILEAFGEIPIPPYLNRRSEEIDNFRYQTVYAEYEGSVAAPTAGLHFTNEVLEKLDKRLVLKEFVTLHVGAGTFKPIKSKLIEDHVMHSEWIEVNLEAIENMLDYDMDDSINEKTVIAIGTTSLRTIESIYWMGVKSMLTPNCTIEELEVNQWDSYELPNNISVKDSLTSLIAFLRGSNMKRLVCKTQLIIVSSYELKVADALITNFHQPKSSLLLIISAFLGDKWKSVYKYAMDNDFRFLSYGDGCLFFKN